MDYLYLLGTCIGIFILVSLGFREKPLRTKLIYTLGVIVTVIVVFAVIMYIGWNYGDGGDRGRNRAPDVKKLHIINTSDASKYAVLSYSYKIADEKKGTSDTLYVGKSSENQTAVFQLPLETGDTAFLTDFKLEIMDPDYHTLKTYTEKEFFRQSEAMPSSINKRNADLWVLKVK
ncbi:hypothetical protein CLV32_2114 [Pedobacter duraquae]|uniref:Uncharacterized protein n=2 Tax=Pedobacter duraquae TaxID=425511 RepID=A0A4R6ILZ3_9SPHI|nr:hypothetical protein CLV32_2114 [Pedobacter duraquae]